MSTKTKLAVVNDAPKRKRRSHFSELKSIDGEARDDSYGAWSLETKALLNLTQLKNLYFSEGWVYISVDAIAQPISELPWGVFRQNGDQKKTWSRVPSQLDKMLDEPNRFQSDAEFKQTLAIEYTLMGNCLIMDFSSVNSMYSLPTEDVMLNFGNDRLPKSYRIITTDEDKLYRKVQEYPLEMICHIKRPNPSSIFWGLSPFIPTKGSVLFNRYSRDYLNAFYQKGATPQMYLEIENTADEKQLVRLMRSFEQAYTGRRNMRRTMVLPKGVKATVADNKIADQNLYELVKMNREEIIAALRVPKHALGLQESGSLGSQEHLLALKYFWQAAIIPTANAIVKAMTRHFRNKLRQGEEIRFDFSQVGVLQDDLKAKAELANAMTTTMTLNEVRAQVWGLSSIQGGDALPGKAPPPAPFAFSLPQAQETKAEPELQSEDDPIGKWFVSKMADRIKKQDESYSAKVDESLPAMTSFAVDLLGDQWIECIKIVNKEFVPNAKSNDDIEKQIDKALQELEEKHRKTFENNFSARMDLGYQLQAGAAFQPQFTEAMLAAQDRDAKGRFTLLKERAIEFFKSTRATTTNTVMGKVSKALKEGWTIDQLRDELVRYTRVDVAYRAQVIARTETLTAMSYGAGSMTQTAQELIPDLKKIWVATMDDRTRDEHFSMHGKVANKKTGLFKLPGGEETPFPRGPGLSAKNSIQCRCRYIDVLPEDVAEYSNELRTDKTNFESKKP
jgi:HK97 family phage portal protein